jgi:hypothetical protein
VNGQPDAPRTPDVSRSRRASVSRTKAAQAAAAAAATAAAAAAAAGHGVDFSPMIVSAGMSMVNREAANLRERLATAHSEVQHLRASLRLAEEQMRHASELSEEQILQLEDSYRTKQVFAPFESASIVQ